MYSWWIFHYDCFIIMKWPSLFLVYASLRFTLSDILFCTFNFKLFVSLYLVWVPYRQPKVGCCLLSNCTVSVLNSMFRLSPFNVAIFMVGFKFTVLLFFKISLTGYLLIFPSFCNFFWMVYFFIPCYFFVLLATWFVISGIV